MGGADSRKLLCSFHGAILGMKGRVFACRNDNTLRGKETRFEGGPNDLPKEGMIRRAREPNLKSIGDSQYHSQP